MTVSDSDYHTRILLLEYLNIRMVMDQAQADPVVLAQLVAKLEERGAGNLTREEKALLQWGLSTQRIQGEN